MGTITILRADGSSYTTEVETLPLDEMQKLVDGYIEVVPYFDTYDGEKCVAICDEEGKLKGKAMNQSATREWWQAAPQWRGQDHLVGDVLIIQGVDLLGNF